MDEDETESGVEPMHHREITLADGRYMIFYTFGDEDPATKQENDIREDV